MWLDVGELFARYQGVVYRRCLKLLGHPEDAAEAVQEVFCAAVKGWGRFRLQASPLTWLYAIATRHCLQQLRNRHTRAQRSIVLEAEPTEAFSDPSARPELERMLRLLEPEELVLFTYAFVDELSQEEMAQLCRVSRKTLGKRLRSLVSSLQRPGGMASDDARLSRAQPLRSSS